MNAPVSPPPAEVNPADSLAAMDEIHALAKDSLAAQSEALGRLAAELDDEFKRAIKMILASKGRTIICGMGKSGLVGKKIAATLASTGTPSFFMHPAEAFHGDLGMITPEDILVLISYSGETEEVTKLIPSLKNMGNQIISIVGNEASTLGKHADVVLKVEVEREVCPNNLAPTTSTIVTMGMGDALAVALIKARDFKPMDFARYHPGGSLGRRLLTRVRDAMRREVPTVSPDATVHECLFTMTSGRMGLAVILDDNKNLVGLITDGDLRRAMLKENDLLSKPVIEFATKNPQTIDANVMLNDAEALMHSKKIRVLVVTGSRSGESEQVIGVLEIFD
ncbi:MAG: KpsF/GutQ family sugar-phosphate isomerase [Thiotrichales bacterium]